MTFVAVKDHVMRGKEVMGRMVSHNFAVRTANALNRYEPDSRGQ